MSSFSSAPCLLGVKILAQGCRNLQVVYLRRCANVDDEGIMALAQCCPLLRELNIGCCPRVTNNSLEIIGQNSAQLRSINVSHSDVSMLLIQTYWRLHFQFVMAHIIFRFKICIPHVYVGEIIVWITSGIDHRLPLYGKLFMPYQQDFP